jgi:cytochrome c2
MKRLGTVILLLTLLSLAACGRQLPEGGFVAEDLGPTSFDQNTAAAAVAAEANEATEEEAEGVVEEEGEVAVEAAVENEAVVAEVTGDAAAGALLFANVPGNAPCSSCHYVDSEQMLVGPGMLGLGGIAGERVSGESAVEYLRHSILAPNDYVVEGYPAMVMPQNYGDSLTEEDINDLIAYMLSL